MAAQRGATSPYASTGHEVVQQRPLEASRRSGLAVLLATLPEIAFGQVMTGNDILAICSSDDLAQAGACAGYVIGVNEGLIAGATLPFYATGAISTADEANAFSSQVLGFCLPTEVESGQLLDVLVLYLQAHPESRHMPARGLYLIAMQEAFPLPCPSGQ